MQGQHNSNVPFAVSTNAAFAKVPLVFISLSFLTFALQTVMGRVTAVIPLEDTDKIIAASSDGKIVRNPIVVFLFPATYALLLPLGSLGL